MSYEVKIVEREDKYADGRSELIIFVDGKEHSRECDGGEPEDNYFLRNYHWIKPALEAAYLQGQKDALTKHRNCSTTTRAGGPI